MAFVAIAAGVSAVGGLVAANQAKKAQAGARYAAEQEAARDRAFHMGVYQDEKNWRDAAAAPLWNFVNAKGVLGFGKTMGAVNHQYDVALGSTLDKLNNAGQGTNSGLTSAVTQASELSKAKTLSDEWQSGLLKKLDVANMLLGKANPVSASGGVTSNAGMYSRYADQAGAEAGAAYGAVGGALGNLGWYLAQRNKTTAPPPSTVPPPTINMQPAQVTQPIVQTPMYTALQNSPSGSMGFGLNGGSFTPSPWR